MSHLFFLSCSERAHRRPSLAVGLVARSGQTLGGGTDSGHGLPWPVDGCRRGRHLWTTLAEHVFDVAQCLATRRAPWSNRPVPSAVGHHRSLSAGGAPRGATTFPGLVDAAALRARVAARRPAAGVTVAAYLVPQVMAYAQIAGLPPGAGLVAIVGADPRRTPCWARPASSRSAPSRPPPS